MKVCGTEILKLVSDSLNKSFSNNTENTNLNDGQKSGSTTVNNSEPMNAVPQTPHPQTEYGDEVHEVVTFLGNDPCDSVEFLPNVDPTYTVDALPNADLADFLSRPTLIAAATWTEGVVFPLTLTVHPWHAFFTNSVIKKKIDNYAFINCNLHVKVVINASPFYYGSLLLSYEPMYQYNISTADSVPELSWVSLSQRPHIWLMPQNNQGGELTLPFMYPLNWLPLTDTTALTEMGRILIVEPVPLQNANGVSGGRINYQIYAWATDVKLAGPTFELQSGRSKHKVRKAPRATSSKQGAQAPEDEYSEPGPVTKVATTVAKIADKLSFIPAITPFCKATEMGAKAVAGIASIFGFTNVPVIDNVMPFKNMPFGGLASAEIGVPVEKLTIDPKNELTIDPRTVGLQPSDELAINYLVGRESYLCQLTWPDTDATDDLLFVARVNPWQCQTLAETQQTRVAQVPMALVANCFRFWRGDLIFRFKAVCTQYHKGRLRITWDPITDLVTNSATTETSYTKIVDLAPDMDVEVRVPYQQKWPFLKCYSPESPQHEVTGFSLTPTDGIDNGTLTVRVLNELTAPTASSTIQILVFVRGAENMEFSNPVVPWSNASLTSQASYFTVQSDNSIADDNSSSSMPEQYLIFGGENVKSMRTLLRRAVATTTAPLWNYTGGTAPNAAVISIPFTKYPRTLGYDPASDLTATGLVSAGSEAYSYGRQSVFLNLVPCYVAMRGSMIWHLNVASNARLFSSIIVERYPKQVSNTAGVINTVVSNTTSQTTTSLLTRFHQTSTANGSSGMLMTNQQTQSGIQVLCPHYHNTRFVGCDPGNWLAGSSVDGTDLESYNLELNFVPSINGNYAQSAFVERKVSIGTDFNVFFFLNVPHVFIYSSAP